jgi:Flp pilus assembly protein TadB
MDIFQLLQKNYAKTTADRLQQQMDSAAQIKAEEQKASRQRMARMMADEQERLQNLARRHATQRQKDKQLFLTVGILAVLIIVIVILLTAL